MPDLIIWVAYGTATHGYQIRILRLGERAPPVSVTRPEILEKLTTQAVDVTIVCHLLDLIKFGWEVTNLQYLQLLVVYL